MSRNLFPIAVLAAAVLAPLSGAWAFDESKYPAIEGIWKRAAAGQPAWDPSKPSGRGQEAPLTAEYQASFEANLREMEQRGGGGNWPGHSCLPPGMPGMMNAFVPMDIVVRPDVTYVLIDHIHDSHRRIYTDGRDWPSNIERTFDGYSIGKWVDENGDGRYDALEVETRNMKGPRAFDETGIPLHPDDETVVKERIYLDKADPNVLHDQITTIDHALTRPWTVVKTYVRDQSKYPVVREYICADENPYVTIGTENYRVAPDGRLMPAKKDQAPPDLRYFGEAPLKK